MYIDPHVHDRDKEQRDKETVAHVLSVAYLAGVDAICTMPNTQRPITTRERVLERFALAQEAQKVSPVFYGLYVGLTSNPDQIARAVELTREFKPTHERRYAVVGLKNYVGKSVGDLANITEESQRIIARELVRRGYKGVEAFHCEEESLMRPELWDPTKPITHCLARPPEAEIESVKDQILFAEQAGFRGTIHICHVSTSEAVKFIQDIKTNRPSAGEYSSSFEITCGVTPHHLFYCNEMMNQPNGLFWKVNPPLRDKQIQEKLLQQAKEGKIDCIETDHAPHTSSEKLNFPYMSGIPGIDRWPDIAERLAQEKFSQKQIEDLTFNNAARRFSLEGIVTKSPGPGLRKIGAYITSPYY